MNAAKIKAKPVSEPAEINGLLPIDVIHDRLDQAHATLDLILTLVSNRATAEEQVDMLCDDTLAAALYGAMSRIEEAKDAAEQLHKEARHV